MAEYTLKLMIDSKIIQQQPGDNLNIARKVNGVFTTTFNGASIHPIGEQQPLLQVNEFKWRDEYSTFLSVEYSPGKQVSATTKKKPIKFGQQTTYKDGLLTAAEPADPSKFDHSNSNNTFLVCSVPDYLKASVACKVGEKWEPIYVDHNTHTGEMDKQLTPLNEYCLFWDNKVTTTTMIDYNHSTNHYTFTFGSDERTKILRYGYKEEDSPVGKEQPGWYAGSKW